MRLTFFFKEALRSIGRNPIPSFAALMAVLVTVLVLGVFIPVVQVANGAADDVRGRILVNVYLKSNAKQADVQRVQAAIAERDGVKGVQYVSKEAAYAEEKRKNPEAYQLLGSNPLPDTLRVTPSDPDDADALIASLQQQTPAGRQVPFDESIGKVQTSRREASKITQVTGAVKISMGLLAGLLVLASVLLVSNTIRLSLFSRRREVEVMKLVGATDGFIRWPFVLEGLILGAIGGTAAIALLGLAKVTLIDRFQAVSALVATPETISFGLLVAVLVVASVGVAAAGSGLSLRRFLRV